MLEKIERILGSRSKIRVIDTLLKSQELLSIREIALKSKVPYSVTHKDIMLFLNEGVAVKHDLKHKTLVRINEHNELVKRIENVMRPEEEKAKNGFKEIAGYKEGLIILHHNADPDALGSGIALARGLAQTGLKCDILVGGGVSRQSKNILEKYPYPLKKEVNKIPKLVFILDSSSPEQIGNIEIPKSAKTVLIDHHEAGALSERADLKLLDSDANSTAILVYGLLKKTGIRMTKEIAFFLLTGIVSDSAFFRISNQQDLRVAVELLNYVDLEDVFAALSRKPELSEKTAVLKAMRRLEIYNFNGILVGFSRIGSFEASVARNLIKSGADIAIVENVQKNEIRISARSKQYLKGRVDLVDVLKTVEPLIDGSVGGHITAASANGRNTKCLRAMRNKLIEALSAVLESKPKAIR